MKKIGRPRSLDYQEIHDKIVQGIPASEIARELNISTGSVYKVARENNIKAKPPQKKENPQLKQIVSRVIETGNGYQVDREFGLSPGTAKKLCRKHGIDYPYRIGRTKDTRTLDEKLKEHEDWRRVFDLYNSGMNFDEISEETKIHRKKIPKILRHCGISVGRGTNTKRFFVPRSVVALYESGLGCKEISEQIGMSPKVILTQLTRWNIPRRTGKAEGSKNPQWKGGRRKYTVHKYRRQCYEVAAICLKRPVPNGHVIHHIDENPKNNHPSNLLLFSTSSLHAKYHQRLLKSQFEVGSEESIQMALEIGAVPLPEPDFQLEF